jgi:hypothetical protein
VESNPPNIYAVPLPTLDKVSDKRYASYKLREKE